ncbi:PAQR family membrane homeostasis protein TrhA, partial [Dokdonella sp.]|uniref:PAQR family membrane homeostasis protein TrhA n=1 Tax=Dokdonella sp. TaxID=2291710 RepID=UPI003C3419C6
MPNAAMHPQYSTSEELASSLSHALGIVLSIAGLAVLAAFSALHGGAWRIASVCVYGTTLVLLYTASTLYHAVPNPRAKPILRLLDHSAIYLLIAGTYTPFALISLRGSWGWALFAIVWTLAIIGIALELRHIRNRIIAALLYVGMGWVGIIAIKP